MNSLTLKISYRRNMWQAKKQNHDIIIFDYFSDILNQILRTELNLEPRDRITKSIIFLLTFSKDRFDSYQLELKKYKESSGGCYYKASNSTIGDISGRGWLPPYLFKEYLNNQYPEFLYIKLEKHSNVKESIDKAHR